MLQLVLPVVTWPLIALAVIQIIDGLMSVKPVRYVAEGFEAVNLSRRLWWMIAPLKFAAATGLILGTWVPFLAALACAALAASFLVAIGMHLGARDLSRNRFINAIGMFAICAQVGLLSFLSW
ncbi:DoxX family protein [Microbacterium sp.]|uniref:DoxX family protein n=1 Tax=Microbacterium sp. TaxID=51671 RepID=UPI0028122683|nr:DoxX family protein [Microbacterium sp.]